MTMVAGRIVVDEGRLLTGDLAAVIAEANVAVPGLFQRREEWLQQHRSVNALRVKTE
jgi:5-methylthioadenosine/S-adenosylhomocysteine deaminase